MNHSFNVEVATKYGIDEAILLENLMFWVSKNRANEKHYYDGEHWTYNSQRAFTEIFPYWSRQKVQRILSNLKKHDLILTGNYNEHAYDRTQWYTLTDRAWEILNPSFAQERTEYCSKPSNEPSGSEQPIPDINTDINTDSKTSCSSPVWTDDNVEMKMAKYMAKRILENYPKAKIPKKFDAWCRDFDLLMRRDGRTVEEVRELMLWLYDDEFWRTTVRSPSGLRKHWDTIYLQKNRKNIKAKPKEPRHPKQRPGESYNECLVRLRDEMEVNFDFTE